MFRHGAADRGAVLRASGEEMRLLRPAIEALTAMSNLTDEERAQQAALAEAFPAAAYRYTLAAARPGALRRCGLLFGPEDEQARVDIAVPARRGSSGTLRPADMQAATRALRAEIEAGRVSRSLFTREQLADIRIGSAQIDGLTWHHDGLRLNLDGTGPMLLLDEAVHRLFNHAGWFSRVIRQGLAMSSYEWRTYYSEPGPGVSEAELTKLEQEQSVIFPVALREGFKAVSRASIFKNGRPCFFAVTAPKAMGGEYRGYFQVLELFARLRNQPQALRDWVEDVYEQPMPDIFPFSAQPGGGWLCLNYQGDPTRSAPSIWCLDMNEDTFDAAFHKLTDSFDQMIEMLIPEEEYGAQGWVE